MPIPQKRFHTLDAMRGVAAIVVVTFHWPYLFQGRLFPHGALAVDFFFMLSGFVLTRAYQKRLDGGWSALSFLRARLIRLYPIYLVGLGLGAALAWKMRHAEGGMSGRQLAVTLLLGVLFLPSPANLPPLLAYPFNGPAWSLFAELVANLFHAIALRRRNLWVLAAVIVTAGVAFAVIGMKLGMLMMGGSDPRIYLAIPRVLFSYTIGIVLYRLWSPERVRWTVPAMFLGVLLFAVLAVPLAGAEGGVYEFCVIVMVFPAIVLLGASSNPSPGWEGAADRLGRISYPMYLLHMPLLPYFQGVWTRVSGHDLQRDTPWSGVAYVAVLAGLSLLLEKFYDIPVRASLQKTLPGSNRS